MNTEEEILSLRQTVKKLEDQVSSLMQVVQKQMYTKQMNVSDLIIENSLRFGNGTGKTIRRDREGIWVGADTIAEITGTTPIPGTAITIDGLVYAKDGASGTFTEYGGRQLVFVNGICTDII